MAPLHTESSENSWTSHAPTTLSTLLALLLLATQGYSAVLAFSSRETLVFCITSVWKRPETRAASLPCLDICYVPPGDMKD